MYLASNMSELNVNAIKKLKVAELRAELTRRGLDSKGNKPVLVERLIEAISSGDQDSVEQPAEETPQEMAADTSQEAVEVKQDGEAEADKEEVPVQQAEDPTPVEESAAPPPIEAETKAEPEKVEQSNVNNDEPEEKTEQEEEPMDQSSAPSGEGEGRKILSKQQYLLLYISVVSCWFKNESCTDAFYFVPLEL